MLNLARRTKTFDLKQFAVLLMALWSLAGLSWAAEAGPSQPLTQWQDEISMEWGNTRIRGEIVDHTVSFSTERLSIHARAEGGCLPVIDGCGTLDQPGAPALPLYSIEIPLNDNYHVTGVKVRSGTFSELKRGHAIAPVPELNFWSPGATKPERKQDPAIYASQSFFPGRLFDLDQGHGANGSSVFLKIYPLQYSPAQGKLVMATDLHVELICSQKPAVHQATGVGVAFIEPSLILCPEALEAQANRLAALHLGWGRPTKVMTMESVKATYGPAEDPAQSGYSNPGLSHWDKITGYDYDLALRTVSMLRDNANHPNLESIAILGDAALVPPSYYFYFNYGSATLSWVSSDIYYESPDYDFSPDYLLGRISINDASEADLYIDKVEAFVAASAPSWSHKVTAGGGIPFSYNLYMGELIQAQYFNEGAYDSLEPTVQYFSEDTFTKEAGREVFKNGGQGFYTVIAHGSGSGLFYDNGGIGANELLNYTPCNELPIVISVSCMNGAYDSDLMNLGFSRSFSESVILSPAAGICYIGGSRNNSGVTSYVIEDSVVKMVDQNYMIAMLKYVMQSYDHQTERLGELIQGARLTYLAEKGTQAHNKFTYLAFCLHGDPELPLLARPNTTPFTVPECQMITPYEIQNKNAVISLFGTETLDAHFETTSPEVKIKIVHPCQYHTACIETHPSAGTVSVLPMQGSHWSVLRAAGADGKESWNYLLSNLGSLAVDGGRLDWRKGKLPPIAIDPPYDMTDSSYDLVCLYNKRQDGFDYVGFDVPFNVPKPANYCIAVDSVKYKGFTGVQGVDRDAASNWVTFGSNHAPDYEIVITRKANGKFSGKVYKWKQNQWQQQGSLDDVGMGITCAYNKQHHFIELAIPEGFFGSSLPWHAIIYSSTTNGSPAQDSTPSDPATYTVPQYGSSNANTLTRFVRVPRGQ